MSRSLRVLTIGHSYVVALNRSLIREVAKDPAFDVTVAAPRSFRGDYGVIALEAEPVTSAVKIAELTTRRTRWNHVFDYSYTELGSLIGSGRFDLIHAWEEPYVYAGYQIARALRRTRASFCFRTAQNLVKWYPPPFDYFERAVLARAQGWLAGGHLVFDAMVRRGYPATLGRVLTLAVDTDAFRPLDQCSRRRVREELGLCSPLIGFLGRLTHAKGIDVLMQALEMVRTPTQWSLLMLGSGPLENTVQHWAEAHGWSNRVRIKNIPHQEVPHYLAAADLLVAPSQTTRNWREQFGRMVIEAFASGVPLVGSDSGEIPYVVGDAGRIVSESDPSQWAHTIEELLGAPEILSNMARSGLERVQSYSVTALAKRYRQYYGDLAAASLS